MFDGKRLSVVGRGVTCVDRGVPSAIASAVTSLFLSDNCLGPLDGLGRFVNVRCLSLANNRLRSFEDLQPLQVRGGLLSVMCIRVSADVDASH